MRRLVPLTLLLAAAACTESSTPKADAVVDVADSTGSDAAADADAAGADVAADSDAADDAVDADVSVGDPLSWSVKKPGPFQCGHRIRQTTWTQPANLGDRTIDVHLWYPTTDTTGDHPTYVSLFSDPTALEEASLAKPVYKDGFPVLVHSHGYKGFSGNSATYFCFLATHGWLAVVPEHLGNTLLDTPDPLPLEVSLQRPLDIKAALDWVQGPPKSDPLANQVDMKHVGMSGHSFGTYTVWASAGATLDATVLDANCLAGKYPDCTDELRAAFKAAAPTFKETRIKTAVAMAGDGGDLFPHPGKNAVTIPMLQMNGTLNDSGETELFADVTAVDLTWVDVEGGCHQLYGLGNSNEPPPGNPKCNVLPNAQGFEIVEAFYLAWLRYTVLGDTTQEVVDIATGKVSVSPLVTYKHNIPK